VGWRHAQRLRDSSPSSTRGLGPSPGSSGQAAEEEPAEFGIFARSAFFEEGVERLEFEVRWHAAVPRVGVLKPGGSAAQRGLRSGDRLVEIAGTRTCGKGRAELLPLLRLRPLMIRFEREEQLRDPWEPYVELELALVRGAGEAAHGAVELEMHGRLPAFTKVLTGSAAWRAGLVVGDAVFMVDAQPVSTWSRSALMTSLEAKNVVLTVRRRPAGFDIKECWA